MDLSIQKQIQFKFDLELVQYQFLKKENYFNGKLSTKNILFDSFFNQISLRSFQPDENTEKDELKDQITQLQQFVFFKSFSLFYLKDF